jgi:hypothetical protein
VGDARTRATVRRTRAIGRRTRATALLDNRNELCEDHARRTHTYPLSADEKSAATCRALPPTVRWGDLYQLIVPGGRRSVPVTSRPVEVVSGAVGDAERRGTHGRPARRHFRHD